MFTSITYILEQKNQTFLKQTRNHYRGNLVPYHARISMTSKNVKLLGLYAQPQKQKFPLKCCFRSPELEKKLGRK